MKITTKDINEVKVVGFDGELDTNSAPEAESQLKQFVEQGVKKILLNFEKLDFISSSGLRILLVTGQQLKVAGGQLKLCSLNETVQEVFDISGFSTLLDVFQNEADALSGF